MNGIQEVSGSIPLISTRKTRFGNKTSFLLYMAQERLHGMDANLWRNVSAEYRKLRNGMKRYLTAILLCCLLLTGCGGDEVQRLDSADIEDTVTFTDDLGRTVCVARPQRVAAMIGSFADIWCLAGGHKTLAAAANDAWTSFALDLGEEVVNLGAIKEPNVERLFESDPDLILASSNTAADVELLDTFEQAGIPVAYFKVASFPEYLNMLEICTRLTGQAERFMQYGRAVEEQVEAARAQADGSCPRVLYVRATGSSCKVKNSRDSVLGEMLSDLECVNIADSENSLLEELSLETILMQDPDYIFMVLQGADSTAAEQVLQQTLLSNPAWQTLTAVKEGRCYMMDDHLYNLKPNARWGEAYEKLANILYPDSGA